MPSRRKSTGAISNEAMTNLDESLGMAEPTGRPSSLSDRTLITARQVLAGQRRGVRASLAFAGPAVVASIAYMDPGNFATNIQAGAKYGYGLLWVVLLANVIAMLFQGLSAKLGIVTGKNLAEMCRDRFPRPVVWAMWVASEIAAMATDLAEFLGGAIAPGLAISADALFSRAARLPRVEIKRPPKVIGTNTVDNLQIGLFYGHIGLVDSILERMIGELGPETTCVATGGLSHLIADESKYITEVNDTLTLEGLRIIYARNIAAKHGSAKHGGAKVGVKPSDGARAKA